MLTRLVWIATSVLLLCRHRRAGAAVLLHEAAPAPALDYDVFKTRVQPILMAMRDGHARCILCHVDRAGRVRGSMRLQPFSPGSTVWNEGRSRKNFDAVQARRRNEADGRGPLLLMPASSGRRREGPPSIGRQAL